MPAADYDARALALPVEEDPESQRRSTSPAWARRSSSFARGRNSPYGDGPPTLKTRMMRNYGKVQKHALKTYRRLTPLQRILVVAAGITTLVLGILFLVFHDRIFGFVAPIAKKWRDIPAGWLILWSLIFVVSFPPLIGYSSFLTIAGFVYGFPNGWFIAASATIIGSTVSFLVSRSVLKAWVHRLVARDPRFAALSLTLKHDGIKLLIMIRLCPLPYSLSNGAIATFPTVHWASFALASAIASPKLLLHVFVGARLGEIAEKGGSMDAKTKAISYLSILIGVVAGVATGWLMYRKTQARARELEAEERQNARRSSIEDLEREYADDEDALEAAETLREAEDDISLRDAWADEQGGYRDDPSDEDEGEGADLDDVFNAGDGDGDGDGERDREQGLPSRK